jgi:hypothetical protein
MTPNTPEVKSYRQGSLATLGFLELGVLLACFLTNKASHFIKACLKSSEVLHGFPMDAESHT